MKTWLSNCVFYEVYPQSFKDSNADGIGDIPGIIEKLDYIAEMGFRGIWLNPCFKSPFMDAGYDVEDFYTVAPRYGTNEDLKRLFVESHKRGIHVLLDLVPCHTSTTCKWFLESMKAEQNAYSGRYLWTDSIAKNFSEVKGVSGTLRGISARDASCAVSYFSTQPALNYGYAECKEPWQHGVDSPDAVATQQELLNIMRFWLGMGCDGFRVDMAGFLVKNDEGRCATAKLWKVLLEKIRAEYPNAVFVSEWGEPQKAIEAGFDMDFLLGDMHITNLFRTENPYFSSDARGNLTEFWKSYMDARASTKDRGLICIPSGNHDLDRYSDTMEESQFKLAMTFLLSMPGIPFIYYGDEIGMRYMRNLVSVEGGYHRCGSRTPMQWDSSTNSGFSSVAPEKLYLPIDPDPNRPTVEAQMQDEDSLLKEVQRLIQLRKQHTALQEHGEIELLTDAAAYPLVYLRYDAEERILVVINPADKEYVVDAVIPAYTEASPIFSQGDAASLCDNKVTVYPLSASLFVLK